MTYRWEERLSNLLKTNTDSELIEKWEKVNSKKAVCSPTLDEYFTFLDLVIEIPKGDPPKFSVTDTYDPRYSGSFFFVISQHEHHNQSRFFV
jgi:hypothetical protein